jgi:hypothetical protein
MPITVKFAPSSWKLSGSSGANGGARRTTNCRDGRPPHDLSHAKRGSAGGCEGRKQTPFPYWTAATLKWNSWLTPFSDTRKVTTCG